jgi:hypothetical protein
LRQITLPRVNTEDRARNLIGPFTEASVTELRERASMSQTIQPPLLPETSPDRMVNCEVALETAFAALVAESEAQGWTSQETAQTLLKIAADHIQFLEAAVASKS